MLSISVGLIFALITSILPFKAASQTALNQTAPNQTAPIQIAQATGVNCADAASGKASQHYQVTANAQTVQWGYFSKTQPPVVSIRSKDYVTMDLITHHAGDDYERMIKGDPGIESIYRWTATEQGVSNRGPGVHVLTGPVYVCGAEPGDLLEVRILDLKPKPSGNSLYPGKTFGSNAAAWWGFHFRNLAQPPNPREVITIYEIDTTGSRNWAKALYSYRWKPQTTPDGKEHATIDYPGIVVDHSKVEETQNVLDGVRVPLRLHIGAMGLAPKEADVVNSIPPGYFGGNIDNRHVGIGTSMYYPVSVSGGLFSAGDAHASQGDSELDGTAIETSLIGTFQFVLHKKSTLPGTILEKVDYPLLETPDSWIVHGFTFRNYLAELGKDAQTLVFQKSSLDPALKDCSTKLRDFLMNGMNLTEDEAYSLITVGSDFAITQVVDGNWGVHGIIPKGLFEEGQVKPKPMS
ncbi:MAG: acetamidase/formamidase family protein [Oculatellaceae cyanobacterium Prado106]|jgi:acetamidase/formamidase|nr:acetamidase/formamidase family protein [Oculatellaceae cyanobacterium Prado106]